MQAVILAGGKGTRLKPYTTVLPKPLMPIGDMPILAVILKQLKLAGFTSVVLAVGYMKHLFQAFFQNGERYGIDIKYTFEEKPLGTAGPLSNIVDILEDDFLLMNGDILTTLNYFELFQFHKEQKAAATIAIHERTVHIDYGVIESDHLGNLKNYIEKPKHDFNVSMGVNVLSRDTILKYLHKNEFLNAPDLIERLKEGHHTIKCYGTKCEWLDIGRVDDYQRAVEMFEKNEERFFAETCVY